MNRLHFILLTLSLLSLTAMADDWPQWRGPGGDGVLPGEAKLADSLPEKLEPVWSAQADEHKGETHASPIIADGKAYLHTTSEQRVKKDGKTKKISRNILLCVSLKDGKQLWRSESHGETHETPCYTDGKLYHINSGGELVCRDAAKGDELWKLKLNKRGTNSSPVSAGDVIAVVMGRDLIAVDPATRKVRWKKEIKAWNNSPAVWTHKGESYVIAGNEELTCAAVKDGSVLWTLAGTKLKKDPASPVVHGDRMVTLWEGSGLNVYELGLNGPKRIAQAEGFVPQTGGAHQAMTPAFDGKRVYAVDKKKTFCFDIDAGKIVWEAKKGETHCSPILAGDKLISPAKRSTRLIDAKTGKILADMKIDPAGCSSPAMSGSLLVVNSGRTLECYDLSKAAASSSR
ncbi:MAG: PQQ-binding-like beta-propeller repeat protein [Phycisphaerae bacterium]